jgi:formate hydrogenlyase subunit 6/NADH:ubiquinone oxidoreductase subunit I
MPARTVKLTPPERTLAVQSYVVEVGKGLGITTRHFLQNFFARVPWVTLGVLSLIEALVAVGVIVVVATVWSMEHQRGFLTVFGGVPAGLGLLALVAGAVRASRRTPAPSYLRIKLYPDISADYYPPRFRGEHRLMRREDESVRCVACMMCATVCPADCIHIVAGDAATAPGADPLAPPLAAEKFPVRFEIDELRCVVCGLCVEACPCDAIRMDTGRHVTAQSSRRPFLYDRQRLLALGGRSVAVPGGEGPGWRERELPPGLSPEASLVPRK